MRAPSEPLPTGVVNVLMVILLFAKLASLSEISNSSAHTGAVLSVCPCISTVGVTAIGLPAPSNPICCDVVPVRYVSFPLASTIIALLAVSHVRSAPTLSSLFVHKFVIFVVFVAIRADNASRATLIEPEIDPRVNI